jgi:pimeloyl-ACP methyl ester carboxylesterase
MTPGKLDAVGPYSTAPRAGNVYLLRGWIGVFSTGIDRLGERVNQSGVKGEVFQDDQWRDLADAIAAKYKSAPDPEPLVLVGHSYGADHTLSIARELESRSVPVDLIVTLDPTTPPNVPKNVRRVYNLYQPSALDTLPFMRGIPLTPDDGFNGRLDNVNIRVDRTDLCDDDVNHFNIEKKDKIHAETIKQILAVCPPRPQWTAAHRTPPPPTAIARAPQPLRPAIVTRAPSTKPSGTTDTSKLLSATK